MRNGILCILLFVILNSCATLFNSPTVKIRVATDRPTELKVGDQTYKINNQDEILVHRGKDTLVVIARSDSMKKEIKLIPKNSLLFYANVYTYGAGFIFDYNNPKRFTYQRNLFLNYATSDNSPQRFSLPRKGQFNVICSLPWINNFYLHPQNEAVKNNIGYWGFSTGLDYYYTEKKFLSLRGNAVTDFFLPVPAAVDFRGEFTLMSSEYISFTDNFQFKNFSLGYGLNYAWNKWDHRYYGPINELFPSARIPVTKSNQSIGFTLNEYYQCSKHFFIGLIYRPTIFAVSPVNEIRYEHLISIDFAWKWNLKK